jgi:L-lactate utilization protein LutC
VTLFHDYSTRAVTVSAKQKISTKSKLEQQTSAMVSNIQRQPVTVPLAARDYRRAERLSKVVDNHAMKFKGRLPPEVTPLSPWARGRELL